MICEMFHNDLLSFGDGNAAGSLETTPKAVRGCGIRP